MKQQTMKPTARRVLMGLSGLMALTGLIGPAMAAESADTGSLTSYAINSPAYATRHESARLLPYWDAWLMGPVSAGIPGQTRWDGNDAEAPGASDQHADSVPKAETSQSSDPSAETKPESATSGPVNTPAAAAETHEPAATQPASAIPATPASPVAIPKPSAKAWLYISKKSQRIYLKDIAPGTTAPDAKPEFTLASWPVSTARYSLSTPVGRFRIISQVPDPPYSGRHGYYKPKDPRNPLGSRWMGLNVGHFRTGVPIGIHGTNEPDKIGQAVSDGCVRLRNGDVETLFKLARVSMPVVISNQ